MKELFRVTEEKMQKSVQGLMNEYAAIRAGRANPAVLDKVRVDYYGVETPINQMAAVSVPDARTLMIQPWDKTTLKAIEKAIQMSDIGINPQNDGTVIRLMFPPLTEERRRELGKSVLKMGEDFKVSVRGIRRDSLEKLKAMKKNNEITEDDQANGEKKMQTLTDKYCKEIDDLAAAKEKEIMEL
ncbi:MAG: ribosome recycling factor [Ruminococcaceae bacterium]|nr:ribosome recycling factor [Oscillospiraceae bacterium]